MSEMIFALFLIPPFVLGFFHARVNKEIPAILIYYRYFMTFNVIFGGIFVAARMFLDGPAEAQSVSWEFSPMFYLYGAALLSMALMGAFTLFSRHSLLMAPAILWTIFLSLATTVNLIGLVHHTIEANSLVIAHMIFNALTIMIMLGFLYFLRQEVQY